MHRFVSVVVAGCAVVVGECLQTGSYGGGQDSWSSNFQPSNSNAAIQAAAKIVRHRLGDSTDGGTMSSGQSKPHFEKWSPAEGRGCMAAFFAGQGFQKVGMGLDTYNSLPAARALWAEASEVLGYDLWELVSEGPAERLSETEFSQPAILVASLAAVEQMKAQLGADKMDDTFCVSIGFSIGEYAALVFAGSLKFRDAVRLVQVRAKSMMRAAQLSPQAMASVDGASTSAVEEICAEVNARFPEDQKTGGFAVGIANRLGADLNVITGSAAACEEVTRLLVARGVTKKTKRLPVSGAFHSPFMQPAADALAAALKRVEISRPRMPVIFNVDGKPHADPEVIRKLMEMQLTGSVQLASSLESILMGGVRRGVEFGPTSGIGAVMKRVAKQTLPAAEASEVKVDSAL